MTSATTSVAEVEAEADGGDQVVDEMEAEEGEVASSRASCKASHGPTRLAQSRTVYQ